MIIDVLELQLDVAPVSVEIVEEQVSITELDIGFSAFTGGSDVFPSRTITEDDDVKVSDFAVLLDCTAGPVIASLPQNTKLQRPYLFQKIDDTNNQGKIVAFAGDDIDGSSMIVLTDKYANAFLFAGDYNHWTNIGPSSDTTSAPIHEVPSGAVNDSNTVFTTSQNFVDIVVYVNGLRMREDVDYTITGDNEITMSEAPLSDVTPDSIFVEYLT